VRCSRPSQAAGNENAYSVTGGMGSGKGHITFSLEQTDRKIVFDREREFTSNQGLSSFGFPGSFLVSDPGDIGFLGTFADPRCPTSLDTSAACCGKYLSTIHYLQSNILVPLFLW